MLLVEKETLNVIKGNNRKFNAQILFSFLSVKNPESIKLSCPNAITGCIPDHIVMPYYSHITNRSFILSPLAEDRTTYNLVPKATGEGNRLFPKILNRYGGNPSLVQAVNEKHTHVGYIGLMPDTDGSVCDTITQQLPMSDIECISLRTNPDRIIIDFYIEVFTNNQNDEPFFTHTVTGNDKDFLLIDINAVNVTQLRLVITKATPKKRIWLVSFFAGFEYLFDQTSIIKIKHQQKKSENREGSIGRLYLNTVDVTVSNIDRIFDYENENSPIVKYLNSTATFSITLTLENPLPKPFQVELGTFAVTSFTSSLANATATIKGADSISSKLNEKINLGIIQDKTAYEVFRIIALRIGLDPTGIDESLKQITYSLLPINDTVGKVLNQLCSNTNVFCTARGNIFVATLLKSKHATLRYPARYFELDEYVENSNANKSEIIPNVLNLSYTKYQWQEGIFIAKKIVLNYTEVLKQKLDNKWVSMPLENYINDVYIPETEKADSSTKPTSWQKTYTLSELPDNYHHIEITDPFYYRSFEYVIQTNYDEDNNLKSVTVKLYNYENRDPSEQVTICFLVEEKPAASIIDSQNFTVPSHEGEYIRSSLLQSSPRNKTDANEIEERNAPNKPEVFSLEINGTVNVDRVEVGNYFVNGYFEYIMNRTPSGVNVRAWNYSSIPQILIVNIYGNRLERSEKKITVQARNEPNIRVNGEIVKDITVDGIDGPESANEILRTAMKYYSQVSSPKSVQSWCDPRIQLYDFLAFRKLRYPGYMQGIVDEITLEYQGYLTQKLSLKETQKHNRDARVLDASNATDRPINDGSLISV